MLWYVVIATFFIMLGFIWHEEGWRKALKILGYWLGSLLLLSIILVILKVKNPTSIHIAGRLWWGLWAIGLLMYNVFHGYIRKF